MQPDYKVIYNLIFKWLVDICNLKGSGGGRSFNLLLNDSYGCRFSFLGSQLNKINTVFAKNFSF